MACALVTEYTSPLHAGLFANNDHRKKVGKTESFGPAAKYGYWIPCCTDLSLYLFAVMHCYLLKTLGFIKTSIPSILQFVGTTIFSVSRTFWAAREACSLSINSTVLKWAAIKCTDSLALNEQSGWV